MKKKLIFMFLICVISFSAYSQVSFGANLQAGLPFYTGDDFNGEATLAYTAEGAFVAELPLNATFSVVGDIGYSWSMIGYKVNSRRYMSTWHKISAEALFKAKSTNGKVKPFVQIGPRASFLLKGTQETPYNKFDIAIDNPLVPGYSIGIGVETQAPKTGEVIEFGINYKGDFAKFSDDLNLYSNSLTLSLTIYFK